MQTTFKNTAQPRSQVKACDQLGKHTTTKSDDFVQLLQIQKDFSLISMTFKKKEYIVGCCKLSLDPRLATMGVAVINLSWLCMLKVGTQARLLATQCQKLP